MEPLIIYKGTDEQFLIKLYNDEEKEQPISIDDLVDMEVRLTIGGYVLGKWNKTGSGDFEALTRVDAYNYYFWLETTSNTKLGIIDIWLTMKETEDELSDDIQDTVRASLAIAEIKDKSY